MGRRGVDARDLRHVAADRHPERGEELAGEPTGGDPRRGLPRAGALEHVAGVVEAVLLQSRQVGVAGARQVDLLDPLAALPGTHPLDPVLVVAIGDEQRDRAAERAAVANAGADLGRVLLDLHAPAAAVAELTARHVAVEGTPGRARARRASLDDRGQAGAVGLPGGYEVETRHATRKAKFRPPAARRLITAQPVIHWVVGADRLDHVIGGARELLEHVDLSGDRHAA